MPTHHNRDVFKFAAQARTKAQPCALCFVTHVSGGTLRSKGAVIAVTPDETSGYVSSGCVDADIVLRARRAITSGQHISLRYGEGSSMRDIVLPCGGTIDILIVPLTPADIVQNINRTLESRQSVDVRIDANGELGLGAPNSSDIFSHTYTPPLRIRIAGRGEAVTAVARLSENLGYDICIQTPMAQSLTTPDNPPPSGDDMWTALVLLFHDHEWEPQLLKQGLAGPAFYIGAMGSAQTHKFRCERLAEIGVGTADIARIHGPIGVIPAARDANTLALSVLTEITETARKSGLL